MLSAGLTVEDVVSSLFSAPAEAVPTPEPVAPARPSSLAPPAPVAIPQAIPEASVPIRSAVLCFECGCVVPSDSASPICTAALCARKHRARVMSEAAARRMAANAAGSMKE